MSSESLRLIWNDPDTRAEVGTTLMVVFGLVIALLL